jgi:hypothetical protein
VSCRCGLLADLAAATERTFGTQIQRVMAWPSAVRCHYGHPDLWNKMFSMTRGGVSKSNAVQHVSEDAFGGMNALKRGGFSCYVSYISVGKGRDMGLDSILGFEVRGRGGRERLPTPPRMAARCVLGKEAGCVCAQVVCEGRGDGEPLKGQGGPKRMHHGHCAAPLVCRRARSARAAASSS